MCIRDRVSTQSTWDSEAIMGQLELLLERCVVPELRSPHGYLRARACEVLFLYGHVPIQNKATAIAALEGLCACLEDKELPVRVKAAAGLASLLRQSEAAAAMRPNLESAIKVYLDLMAELDHDKVTLGLERLIGSFTEEIQPFAVQLVAHLASKFLSFARSRPDVEDDEYEGGEGEIAAAGILGAIRRVLLAELPQSLFTELVPPVVEILNYTLSEEGADFLEEGTELLNVLMYSMETVPPSLWAFFPVLISALIGKNPQHLAERLARKDELTADERATLESELEGWSQENIGHIVPCFALYLAKGKPALLTATDESGTLYIDLLLRVVDRTIEVNVNGADDADLITVLRIYIALIENYAGLIDDRIPFLIDRLLEFLNLKRRPGFRATCVETICLALWYNPVLTLRLLSERNALVPFFDTWYSLRSHFKRDFEKARVLFGLSSVLRIPINQLPEVVVGVLDKVVKELCALTNELLEMREEDVDEDANSEEEEEAPDEEEIEDVKQKIKAFNKGMKKDDFVPDDDLLGDDDEEADLVKNRLSLYDSPLELIDEILFLKESLEIFATTNSDAGTKILGVLTPEEQERLRQNFATAETQHAEFLARKHEEEARKK
eukprot:TRINITY_DN3860_c0_g1_i1.p1 TRINITY_DN3860_c0_g1~~TRINITY_DN3860_c0_g1_i1.p1  ORF type:complete len:614 (+),score=219.71 TRINITY_DN3860_c0_g1_i1:68-1909(+)